MSTILDESRARPRIDVTFSARLAGLVAILLFEVLALGLRFDSKTILRRR